MPTWVTAYLALYVMYSLWAVIDDIKNMNEPFWYSAAEIASDTLLLIAALAFWFSPIRVSLGQFILPTFALGCALFIAQAARSFWRQVVIDRDLSFQGKLFVGVSGSSLIIAFSTPLLYWGFNVAVLNSHAGT